MPDTMPRRRAAAPEDAARRGRVCAGDAGQGVMDMAAMMLDTLTIRRASVQDAAAVLGVFDEVIAWFVGIGNERQWGSVPWSTLPQRVARVSEACALPEAWVAEAADGRIHGALVLGEAMPYVPPATEPEIYVRVLVASRDARTRGIGRRLLAFADERARAAGVERLRVDCYGGGTGALVRFYEACGYERISSFDVEGWPGELLGRRLQGGMAS